VGHYERTESKQEDARARPETSIGLQATKKSRSRATLWLTLNQSPNQANGGFAPNAVHHMGRIEQNEIASPNTEQCNEDH
jgi:hypothetical protein